MTRSPVVRRGRGGSYELRLSRGERDLLARLPEALVAALEELAASGPEGGEGAGARGAGMPAGGGGGRGAAIPAALRRLFPPAYPTDDAAEAGFSRSTHADLLAHHREALETLRSSARQATLDREQLEAWLAALTDLRLVLGTVLEVTEDAEPPPPDDPRSGQWSLYAYLTYLASEVVDLLAQELPPPRSGADDLVPDDPWGDPPGGLRWDGTPLPGGGTPPRPMRPPREPRPTRRRDAGRPETGS